MKLHVFPPMYGEPSGSPFSNKAIALMEASGVDFEMVHTTDSHKMPKGKLPVLEVNGTKIADSEEIANFLEQQYALDFDAGLTPDQRATSRALIRMAEEHLYFVLLSQRWTEPTSWAVTKREIFGKIPWPMRPIITKLVRGIMVKQANGQGMGRHSVEERMARAAKDLAAIAQVLGDKDYLFGTSPTRADYTIMPLLRFINGFPERFELEQTLAKFPSLIAYAERGAMLYPRVPE